MAALSIELAEGITGYLPGERVRGEVAWTLPQPPRRVQVRLIWFTRASGPITMQSGEAGRQDFDSPPAHDRRSFALEVPEGPYSFIGKMVSVAWAVELVAEPSRQAERVEIVVSPTGLPVELHAAEV